MINPKRTTQCSVMQQRNVSHSTVGIVASGYAKPGRRVSILKCIASHCQRSTQPLLISHLLQFQSASIKIISRQTITSHQTAMVILCESWCWLFFVSLERRIWQMDIYVVQWASIGPPREFF